MAKKKSKPKGRTIMNPGPKPKRNITCECGSGKKFKYCCGAPAKICARPKQAVYRSPRDFYSFDQKADEERFVKQWGFIPSAAQLMMFVQGTQADTKAMILHGLAELKAPEKYAYAVDKLGFLITPRNKDMCTPEELELWATTLAAHDAYQALAGITSDVT